MDLSADRKKIIQIEKANSNIAEIVVQVVKSDHGDKLSVIS
jgi:hypothetical protein